MSNFDDSINIQDFLPSKGKKFKPRSEEAGKLFSALMANVVETMTTHCGYSKNRELAEDLSIISSYRFYEYDLSKTDDVESMATAVAGCVFGNSDGLIKTQSMFTMKLAETLQEEFGVSRKEAINMAIKKLERITSSGLIVGEMELDKKRKSSPYKSEEEAFREFLINEVSELIKNKKKKSEGERMPIDEILKGIEGLKADDFSNLKDN